MQAIPGVVERRELMMSFIGDTIFLILPSATSGGSQRLVYTGIETPFAYRHYVAMSGLQHYFDGMVYDALAGKERLAYCRVSQY